MVDVAHRWGVPNSAAGPRDQPGVLHIGQRLNKLLWHEGRIPSNTAVLIKKYSLGSFPGCYSSRSITQYNYRNSSGQKSVRCAVNCQTKVMLLDRKQSWKASGEHAQNLFNIQENKLLCVTTGNTVGEITGASLIHRQGASAGGYKPRKESCSVALRKNKPIIQ